MKTKEELLLKLSALLKEYKAEILLEDYGKGYNHDIKMDLQLDSIYDDNGNILRPFEIVTLGTYLD